MLGEGAIAAPLKVYVQQITSHGYYIKADRFQRVTHFLGLATRLALGAGTTLGTQ